MDTFSHEQALAQENLRVALNAWLEDKSQFPGVEKAVKQGARLDLPLRMGSPQAILHASAGIVFDAPRWSDLTKLCIQSRAHVDCRALDGSTPFHAAASCGNREALLALGLLGADHAACDGNGASAIHLAAAMADGVVESDCPGAIELLAAHACCPDEAGLNPLHHALSAGNERALIPLLEAGADFEAINPRTGLRPLQQACLESDRLAMALLSSNPHLLIELCDDDAPESLSPLAACFSRGHQHAAKELLARGASLDKPSRQGSSRTLRDELASIAQGEAKPLAAALADMHAANRSESRETASRLGKVALRAFKTR